MGESDGRARPARARATARICSFHPFTIAGLRSGSFAVPLPLRIPPRNKKSPRAVPPVSSGRRPRSIGSHSDPGGQAGFLLDRFVGQTPASSLESSTMAAHEQPQNRRSRAFDGVASCHPRQSQDQIQEKICRLPNFFLKLNPGHPLTAIHASGIRSFPESLFLFLLALVIL